MSVLLFGLHPASRHCRRPAHQPLASITLPSGRRFAPGQTPQARSGSHLAGGGSFSLEDGSGQHFVLRLREWTEKEFAQLQPVRPSVVF